MTAFFFCFVPSEKTSKKFKKEKSVLLGGTVSGIHDTMNPHPSPHHFGTSPCSPRPHGPPPHLITLTHRRACCAARSHSCPRRDAQCQPPTSSCESFSSDTACAGDRQHLKIRVSLPLHAVQKTLIYHVVASKTYGHGLCQGRVYYATCELLALLLSPFSHQCFRRNLAGLLRPMSTTVAPLLPCGDPPTRLSPQTPV